MKDQLIKAKNYVKAHQTTIAVTTVTALAGIVMLQQSGIKSLNAFITEKGLYEEYYRPED